MSRGALGLALLLGACAHHSVAPEPPVVVGSSHQPYRGRPGYLSAERSSYRDFVADRRPIAERPPLESAQPDRLRALMATLDGKVAGLGEQPTDADRKALSVTIEEIGGLLAAYPDQAAEVDELRELTDKLGATRGPAVIQLRARMGDLIDLIRLQLLAGR